jgi:peptide/nickel transport system permease protein
MAQTAALDLPAEAAPSARRPFYIDVFVRLAREKPMGLFSAIIVLVLFAMAVAAPLIAPFGPNELGAGARLSGPSFAHIMGTDNLGRDVFSRVVYGARVSMTIGVAAVLVSTLIGLAIGVLSGYFGGITDMIAQRFVDAFIAFPALVFLLAVAAVFRGHQIPGLPAQGLVSTTNVVLMVSVGLLLGVGTSRIIRSATITVKDSTYMEAARSLGCGHARMIFVYVVPNVMAPTITLATLGLGVAILIEASLSFLGLGVPPDTPTWGGMLSREARSWMTQAPWMAIFPGAALSLAVFAFNMLGDALRDLLDPRLRNS